MVASFSSCLIRSRSPISLTRRAFSSAIAACIAIAVSRSQSSLVNCRSESTVSRKMIPRIWSWRTRGTQSALRMFSSTIEVARSSRWSRWASAVSSDSLVRRTSFTIVLLILTLTC